MNKTEEVVGKESVILWKDIDANDPEVAALLKVNVVAQHTL